MTANSSVPFVSRRVQASAFKRRACPFTVQSSVERAQVSAAGGITRSLQCVLFVGNRRPFRTTNCSQRSNRCINIHRCIIDESTDEIQAK